MLILMKAGATREDIQKVKERVFQLGFRAHEIPGVQRVAIGITGNRERVDPAPFKTMSGVEDVIPVSKPYKLVGRDAHAGTSIIQVDGVEVGGPQLAIIAGPCSVESREQILETAFAVKEAGAQFLRGGAFKSRSSPYAFQGMREEGLVLLREAKEKTGLKIVTEVKDTVTLAAVAEVADVLQIGARNMQNYSLLEAVGDTGKPVLLKRGMSATIEEFLLAAEYIFARENPRVILCERGIRTFETATRNTLDLNAVPVVKKLSHLPIIVDPSHGIGMWEGVPPMALAAVAAGADGLMIEVHPNPATAVSDGYQSLKPERFKRLMAQVKQVADAVGRRL